MKAPTCRFCGSANVIKAGKRYNLNSTKQRWKCKACGKRSVEDDGFLHLWYDKWSVTEGIDLYHEGLSTRKVERHSGGTTIGGPHGPQFGGGYTDLPNRSNASSLG